MRHLVLEVAKIVDGLSRSGHDDAALFKIRNESMSGAAQRLVGDSSCLVAASPGIEKLVAGVGFEPTTFGL
jgi:hypothetical protein